MPERSWQDLEGGARTEEEFYGHAVATVAAMLI
jgi:hypothetical protein